MTPEQTAAVLAKCSGFDQRTVGRADVLAWHEVIGYLDLEDCLKAVTTHYSEQSQRAMPADVRKIAIGIRDRRKDAERQEQQRLELEAAPERSVEVTALVHALAATLPQPSNLDRARARAKAERGRPSPKLAKEKKTKKPLKPSEYPPPQTDDLAALASRYLIDGYKPRDVAERFGINLRWCERVVRKFNREEAS